MAIPMILAKTSIKHSASLFQPPLTKLVDNSVVTWDVFKRSKTSKTGEGGGPGGFVQEAKDRLQPEQGSQELSEKPKEQAPKAKEELKKKEDSTLKKE